MDLGHQSVIYPMKGTNYYKILLLFSKTLKAIAYFAAYAILKKIQTVSFLLILKLCAVLILFPIQKPLTGGKSLSLLEWFQVARFSLVRLMLDALWIEGLYLCGPLRFILIFEQSELLILAAASTVVYGANSTSKVRGTICFIIGLLIVVFFDHDKTSLEHVHPEGIHKSLLIHKVYELFSNFGLSDHKVGVVVLLVAICLDAGFAAVSRTLVSSLGGTKRLHALSSLASMVYLVPLFLITKFYNTSWSVLRDDVDLEVVSQRTSNGSSTLLSLSFWSFYVGAVFVLDFYFTSLASARLGSLPVTHLAKVSITLTAFVLSCLWSSDAWVSSISSFVQSPISPSVSAHHLSAGVLFAILTILYASSLLTYIRPGQGPEGCSSGHFIGYSMTGLPLFTAGQTPSHGLALLSNPEAMGLWYHVKTTLKGIMAKPSSRKIFAFLCLNLCFTFVELLYGVWTNSLGLISDGFHMLFDSAALVVGLYAAVVSHWKPTRVFSYGFHSAEVLSGFVNALFLLVISGSVFVNALARIHHPPHIHTDRLMAVSVAGLFVNLVGIFALGHAHSHGGHGACSGHQHSHGNKTGPGHNHSGGHHEHAHNTSGHLHYGHAHGQKKHNGHESFAHSGASRDANLRGVYLHVLADTLGSVGVIVSSYLVSTYGWNVADPICSVFIACAIGYSAMPLLYDTIGSLTLRAPEHTGTPKWFVHKILALDGVLAVYNPFIWSQTRDTTCISVCVQVEPDVCEQIMLARIKELVRVHCPNATHLTVQVEKEIIQNHLQAMGLKPTVLLYLPKTSAINGPDSHSNDALNRQSCETVSVVPPYSV